jgi:NADPH:quinone reductase-like Zn-dependent oxidoreductase
MNAAVLHAFNKPPCFEQFSEPIAEENQVSVHVRAAALKPVDKQRASGSHYAAFRELPVVCGTDGVGCLDDGRRVFFAGSQPPFGSMAQRTVVSPSRCFPIPDNVDDDIAAAVVNPGLSAWGALTWRAQLAPGETVLILGATGVTGKLAIQTAKLLGARRVVAAACKLSHSPWYKKSVLSHGLNRSVPKMDYLSDHAENNSCNLAKGSRGKVSGGDNCVTHAGSTQHLDSSHDAITPEWSRTRKLSPSSHFRIVIWSKKQEDSGISV